MYYMLIHITKYYNNYLQDIYTYTVMWQNIGI